MNVPQFPYESDRASDDYYDALRRIIFDPRVAHFLSSAVLRYVIDPSTGEYVRFYPESVEPSEPNPEWTTPGSSWDYEHPEPVRESLT